ncbi:hypothetical protein FRC01_011631 [Tulasnella sp. 417]|nr:hypothetical protein FRC01_011631 [Tulasnella sp. 417]
MVMTDDIPNCNTLYGPGLKYKPSIRPDNLFKLVGEHSARWRKATLLGVNRSSCANGIQLSQHLQYLVLSGLGSPTADAGITPFSGRTENLLHLKLQNLVVSPKHLIQILASSHRMTSLDLQSLVAPTKEEPPDDPDGGASPAVDLQYLTSLKLKSLPKSILYPTVQNMGTSTLQTAHITHDETVQGNRFPDRSESQFDPFASFIARMATVEPWCFIELHSNKVIVKRPSSKSTCQYIIEILGQHPILLPWLSFVSLPQLPKSSLVQLYLGSDALGEIPGPGVMEALEQFPKLASVCLRGRKESWRWMWLLSLPDAVKRGTSSSDKVVGFWLWPGLRYLNIYGDFVDEFTVLSVLLERHKLTTSRGSSTDNRTVPRQLFGLEVRPGEKEWRAEVVDKIRELLKPGYLKCLKPN